VLDDLVRRGLRQPELLIVDGGSGLDAAIAAVWNDVPVQRCDPQASQSLGALLLNACTKRSPPTTTT
jgi:putative transposase